MLKFDSSKKVVIVGDVGTDIIVHFPKYLDETRKRVEFTVPRMVGGGTCGNTAAAIARLGISPYIVGTIGDDQYGKFVVEDLKKEHVYTDYLKTDRTVNTVGVFAFIDEFGERYLWGWPRVDRSFEKLELTREDYALIDSADWIHSSGMVTVRDTSSRRAVEELFAYAHKKGIPTSYDLNLRVTKGVLDESFRESTMRIVENCSYVLGSAEEEIYYLNPEQEWNVTAAGLVKEDRMIVARMGDRGSMIFTSQGEYEAPACRVAVVDTVGAGDVYNGAFIACMLSGYGIEETLKICNAVSGYTVAHEGARSSPNREELECFLEEKEG